MLVIIMQIAADDIECYLVTQSQTHYDMFVIIVATINGLYVGFVIKLVHRELKGMFLQERES